MAWAGVTLGLEFPGAGGALAKDAQNHHLGIAEVLVQGVGLHDLALIVLQGEGGVGDLAEVGRRVIRVDGCDDRVGDDIHRDVGQQPLHPFIRRLGCPIAYVRRVLHATIDALVAAIGQHLDELVTGACRDGALRDRRVPDIARQVREVHALSACADADGGDVDVLGRTPVHLGTQAAYRFFTGEDQRGGAGIEGLGSSELQSCHGIHFPPFI